jgi:phospholipid/cholesterol/gamma-HCH transport system permease protein
MTSENSTASVAITRSGSDTVILAIAGDWLSGKGVPTFQTFLPQLQGTGEIKSMKFDAARLGRWNSGLMTFVVQCIDYCRDHQISADDSTLPPGVRKLVELAEAVPEKKDAARKSEEVPFLARVGGSAIDTWKGGIGMLTFVGENVLALGRLFRGRAQFRWSDAFLVMQECGPQALGIVALINFLIGLILAFVGATELTRFGASIYVADLVGIATVREMGCIMTGIIICGRTGAAFAAQLGTMKVNQEIEAFQTFGISPVDFLVLPRMLALIVMMPLLVLFADIISIGGGFLISTVMLHITPVSYVARTVAAISMSSFLLGVIKGTYFGVVIALTGCLRGIQCGSNAAAVGQATTSAVVTGITAIIASDGIFAVICNALGI